MSINIPIPTVELVEWGVAPTRHINLSDPPGMERYYTGIEIDFKASASLTEHVVLCAKKGITFALSEGINILGQKIKIAESIFAEGE